MNLHESCVSIRAAPQERPAPCWRNSTKTAIFSQSFLLYSHNHPCVPAQGWLCVCMYIVKIVCIRVTLLTFAPENVKMFKLIN